MKQLSKAAMDRLVRSEFFHTVRDMVGAWDYYLMEYRAYRVEDAERAMKAQRDADVMMHQWAIAKLALKHITGNIYSFTRNGEGDYAVVNEDDCNDRIIIGRNDYKKEVAA